MKTTEANELLIRHADFVTSGRSHNHLVRGLRRGELVRIAPGVYVAATVWVSLFPETQHELRVHAQKQRLGDVVYSHYSAVPFHNMKLLGPWPDHVSVTVPPTGRTKGGRSSGAVIRRMAELGPDDVVEVDGIRVTSPARTAADLSRLLPFDEGVAMFDAARRRRLLTRAELAAALDAHPNRRGTAKALKALAFSTDRADSVQESRSRVLIYQLGFPAPELQHEMICDGRLYRADFWWNEFRHWAEFDGQGKYLSPRYQNGRSPERIVVDEKRREDAIRRHVKAFSRWEIKDLNDPQRLFRILTRDGLPSKGPRMLPA